MKSIHFYVYPTSAKPERVEYLLIPKKNPLASPDRLQMVEPFSFLGLEKIQGEKNKEPRSHQLWGHTKYVC